MTNSLIFQLSNFCQISMKKKHVKNNIIKLVFFRLTQFFVLSYINQNFKEHYSSINQKVMCLWSNFSESPFEKSYANNNGTRIYIFFFFFFLEFTFSTLMCNCHGHTDSLNSLCACNSTLLFLLWHHC